MSGTPFVPLLLALLAGEVPTTDRPTVALTTLDAQYGVARELAVLLTDRLAQVLRDSHGFSRVISTAELEATLGVERLATVTQCDSEGCLAEMLGALGADFALRGSLGRVGESYLFNARIVDVKKGLAAGSISERLPATREDVLLDAMGPAVAKLLTAAGIAHDASALHTATTSTTTSATAPGATPPPEGTPTPATERARDGPPAPAPTPSSEVDDGPAFPWIALGAALAAAIPATVILGVALSTAGYWVVGYAAGYLTRSNLVADLSGGSTAAAFALVALATCAVLTVAAVGAFTRAL
ncbi:MAG: hypothetical protein AB2A00_14350 [Myxococcota bacterium]